MTRRVLPFIIAVVVLGLGAGCGGETEDPGEMESSYSDQGRMELQKVLTIGEETGAIFGNIEDVAVDADGTIFVADRGNARIRVFNSGGDSVATIGRKGEGPGEFQRPSIVFFQRNHLLVLDKSNHRVTSFQRQPPHDRVRMFTYHSASRAFLREIFPSDSTGYIAVWFHFPGTSKPKGEIVEGKYSISVLDQDGELARDSVIVFSGQKYVCQRFNGATGCTPISLTPDGIFAPGPDGTFFAGHADSVRIRSYSGRGEVLRVIRYPYQRVSISQTAKDSVRAEWSDFQKKLLTGVDLPDTYPAFRDLVVDQNGRLWIDVVARPRKPMSEWWILDPEGKQKWKIQLPNNVSVETIRNGRLYGVRTTELGVEAVVVYEIGVPTS